MIYKTFDLYIEHTTSVLQKIQSFVIVNEQSQQLLDSAHGQK